MTVGACVCVGGWVWVGGCVCVCGNMNVSQNLLTNTFLGSVRKKEEASE